MASRAHRDVSRTYPELAGLADLLPGRPAIIDGEIVTLNEAGVPSFVRLQQRSSVINYYFRTP